MTNTLARQELIAIRNQLTILKNVVGVDRLDMIAASVSRVQLAVERLESIDSLVSSSPH